MTDLGCDLVHFPGKMPKSFHGDVVECKDLETHE
jgi:hypothetical protein